MGMPDVFAQLLDFGLDVLATTIDKATGVLSAQTGNSTTSTPDADAAEWWQHAGFASRPASPTQGASSCQALAFKRGDRDVIFASRDTRVTGIYGNLADGETAVYASGAQGITLHKADGSVRALTTDDNTATGNSVFAGISPYYQTANGPATGGEWRVYAPWGGQWQDQTGFHLRTWHGVKIDAGGLNLPAPLPSGSTYMLSADIVHIDAAMLALGRDNGTGQALVQALPLQGILSAIQTLLAAIAATPAAVGTAPAANPAVSDATLALSSALSSYQATCATKCVTAS